MSKNITESTIYINNCISSVKKMLNVYKKSTKYYFFSYILA